MHEALPVFLALALMNLIVGTAARLGHHGRHGVPDRAHPVRAALSRGRRRGAHAGLGGRLGRPRHDARPAARQDLRPENEKPPALLRTGGFPTTRTRVSGLSRRARIGAFSFFICSRSSLRSSFICFVSSGRISLMRQRSRPTITFSNLSTVLPVDVTAMAFGELQVRAVARDLQQIGLVHARTRRRADPWKWRSSRRNCPCRTT